MNKIWRSTVEEGAESEEDDLGCAAEPGADFSSMAAYLKRDEVGKLMNLEKFSRLHHPSSLIPPPLKGGGVRVYPEIWTTAKISQVFREKKREKPSRVTPSSFPPPNCCAN